MDQYQPHTVGTSIIIVLITLLGITLVLNGCSMKYTEINTSGVAEDLINEEDSNETEVNFYLPDHLI